jgi:hypothetical protein
VKIATIKALLQELNPCSCLCVVEFMCILRGKRQNVNSRSVEYLCGPGPWNLWTTLTDHSCGPLVKHRILPTINGAVMGHSRKHPYHPHRGNRKLTPLGCPNTFTIIRNNFFSPLDGRNFLRGGSMDLFWKDPIHV